MEWKTRVTDLLECKYPILQGALYRFGNWKFAAAVAEAGAFGIITAASTKTPERLREEIKQCKDATDKSFGVNLSFASCPQIEEMLEVCISEGIRVVETVAYKPDSLAPRIKEAGLKWIHKSATVKQALHAEKLGADAVIVVGLEGIGFKHPLQLPTLTTTVWGARQFNIPFIAAGGIGDAHGFLGALAMGADGIMMGTAFLATRECPMSNAAKEAIVRATPDNPQLIRRVLFPPDSQKYEEALSMRDKLPRAQWLRHLEGVTLKEPDFTFEGAKGEATLGKLVSFAVGVIDSVPTVKEFIDSIINDAEKILNSWQFLKTMNSLKMTGKE